MTKCEQCKHNGECLALPDQCTRFEPKVPILKVRNLAKWVDENTTGAEFSDYDSPIKVIMSELETKLDGEIMSAVQHYGITVDREELLKALSYDRDQYAKGFNEGHIAGVLQAEKLYARPQGKWIKWNFKTFGSLGDWEYKCSNCKKVYGGDYNFCPNCGADNREINLGGETNDK